MQYKFTTHDPQIIEVIENLGAKRKGQYIELALRYFVKTKKGKEIVELFSTNSGKKRIREKKMANPSFIEKEVIEKKVEKSNRVNLDRLLGLP